MRDIVDKVMVSELAEYGEYIGEEAATLRNDKHLRAVWTMAAIRYAVSRSRNSPNFFDRKTLQFFGETMRDYRRRVEDGTVYVDRLSSRAGRKTYIFDTATHEMRVIRDQEG